METQQNRTNQGVMWGAVLIGLGIIFLLQQIFPGFFGALVWSAAFAVGAVVTYGAYTRNKQNWWLLIPTYVMAFIAAIIQIGSIRWLPGEFVGAFVMLAIGFPFLYVYLKNDEHWWALIPAYTMAAIAGIILASMVLNGEMIASFVMFAIAAPFLYVYLRNRQHWWALIPGGIMAMIGVGLFIAGMAWIFPAVMIVAGLYLLYRQFGKSRGDAAPPTSGPAADRPQKDTPVREFEPIMAGPEADRPQE
jgi:hypothetical protein